MAYVRLLTKRCFKCDIIYYSGSVIGKDIYEQSKVQLRNGLVTNLTSKRKWFKWSKESYWLCPDCKSKLNGHWRYEQKD